MTVGSAAGFPRSSSGAVALADDPASKSYGSLEQRELDELMTTLGPFAARLLAAQDRET